MSKAPGNQPAIVPDVTGQMVSDARETLEEAGFNVQVRDGDDEDNATVVTTNPAANTQAKKGDTVIIFAQPGQGEDGGDGGGFFGGPREDRAARLDGGRPD